MSQERYRATTVETESGAHYDRAVELYALGPSKAAEIVAALDQELAEHPQNVEALLLKARTLLGTNQLDAALSAVEKLFEVAGESRTIYPDALLMRARVLYYLERYDDAHLVLKPYWAFFQSDDDSKARYANLMADIEARLEKGVQTAPQSK